MYQYNVVKIVMLLLYLIINKIKYLLKSYFFHMSTLSVLHINSLLNNCFTGAVGEEDLRGFYI